VQISAERKPDAGKQSLDKGQTERKSSKKGRKTASLSRPVSFRFSYSHTSFTRLFICNNGIGDKSFAMMALVLNVGDLHM
jgi:hypothetical protein